MIFGALRMEIPYKSIQLANQLATSAKIGKIVRFQDINCQFFRQLFECFCSPFIADEEFLNELSNVRKDVDYVASIVDYIGTEFLEVDLTNSLNSKAICSGNPIEIYSFLSIFDNLHHCLFIQNKPLSSAPKHLSAKINDCGKTSVLFSPRTALNRKNMKGIPVVIHKSPFEVEDKLILRNMGVPRSSIDLLSLEMLIRQTKANHLLHVLKRECSKTEAQLKMATSRVILKRAISRHLVKAKRRRNHELLLKKAKLTLQNVEKDRKRKFEERNLRATGRLYSTANEESSIIDNDYSLDSGYSAAAHAQSFKLVKNLAKEWNTIMQNRADSIENASYNRISSMTDEN
uniref:Uncharacterized protein n=1 Tax=Romanomermis culicivorax TaxID=13658 RepID=A0A915JHC6_ROMCU